MTAREEWLRLPFRARRRIVEALSSQAVRDAVSVAFEPGCATAPDSPDMTASEARDYAAALAILDEAE